MDVDRAKSVRSLEGALRRLGWLSAYARQVLMARHLLRNISTVAFPDDIPAVVDGEFALNLFRCAITVLSGVNRTTQQFSSPYEPLGRPETHFLAFARKQRLFSTSIASGMPSVHYHTEAGGGFGFENSDDFSVEDHLLSFEIQAVAKNVSLATKALADRRAEALRNEDLWRGVHSNESAVALRFFENWHEWSGKTGEFWREWYQGFVEGKPLDWELQRRVALIDDAIWAAGPVAVAREIANVRSKYDLEVSNKEQESGSRAVQLDMNELIDESLFPASFELQLGGAEELNVRRRMLAELDGIAAAIPKVERPKNPLGGNNPPPEARFWETEYDEIEAQIRTIAESGSKARELLRQEKPDVDLARLALGTLLGVAGALVGKLKAPAQEFASSFSKELGTSSAKWLVRGGALVGFLSYLNEHAPVLNSLLQNWTKILGL